MQRNYTYDAWGVLTGGTDIKPFANADRARFKGALWAGPQVDVYYMRNRWYEPKSGRFLAEDPIGLDGGINLYTYAADDPVNMRDARGTCAEGMKLELTIHDDGSWEAECVLGGPARPANGNLRGADYAAAFGIPTPVRLGAWGGGAGLGGNPQGRSNTCPIGLGRERCRRFGTVVSILQISSGLNGLCSALGSRAIARMAAGNYSFGGYSADYYGEYIPQFGEVILYEAAFESDVELIRTISHEEMHAYLVEVLDVWGEQSHLILGDLAQSTCPSW